MSNFLSVRHRPATLAGRQRYRMIRSFPKIISTHKVVCFQFVKPWNLLLLALVAAIAQACKQQPDNYSPNSAFYKQQEDSVLVALFNQAIKMDNRYRPVEAPEIGNDSTTYAWYIDSIFHVELIEELGFPPLLGNICNDCSVDTLKSIAAREASRIIQTHKVDPAFHPLLRQMWDKQDLINKVVRKGPYTVMQSKIMPPFHLQPKSMHDAGETYIRFSRVGFNRNFDRAIFQIIYTDPGGGKANLYFGEKRRRKWVLIDWEPVMSWKR
ncbi:hypothetical protein [Hymenobacter sp. BT491]|uniref:hypothetical protein n=1 Tax=Hymenobacter sp. BT491 TaxID=2766779 RepID=UPI0016538E6E|nr:hypothetical protein [Hymenobacter sp. BT491]MBC6990415.1 hypothetical protein [Hymenobacter sp. BT491]